MNASMLDEVEVPTKKQPLHVCPCCKFTFVEKAKFIAHCDAMIITINAAVEKVKDKK